MDEMSGVKYFLYSIYPPFILTIGLIGNSLGLLVLSRRKLTKIGPVNIYRLLFIMDSMYLLLILEPYSETEFGFDLCILSDLSCKVYSYMSYFLQIVSPNLLTYISVEKLVSIKYPKKGYILRNKSVQMAFSVGVLISSCLFYLPIIFFYVITTTPYSYVYTNTTNETYLLNITLCTFINANSQTLISVMDLFGRVLIPFILMSIFSLALLHTIFESRRRVSSANRPNRMFKRDIRFAISSVLLNFIYLSFHLPLSVYVFFPDYFSDLYYMFDIYILYACYSTNFYLIFISNSLFRNEFILIFREAFKFVTKKPAWV